MYFLLGVALSLAFLLVINLLVAVLASAVWRAAESRTLGYSARARSRLIFGLRVLPLAAALVVVSVFVIPAYVLYEPASSGEVVGSKLALIAIASSFGVAFALFRVGRTWLITRRLTANWLQNATVVEIGGGNVPVYRFDHSFPVVAVVGIIRPRVFVADKVLRSLTEDEFRAAIAHEYGHLVTKDNLKRTLLRMCRDLLLFPIGKGLDRAWSECVESLADEYAARSVGGADALDLAAALVKIAKLVPAGTRPAIPVGVFLVEAPGGSIAHRVHRLLNMNGHGSPAVASKRFGFAHAFWIFSGFVAIVSIVPLSDARILSSVHFAMERVVDALR